ncbi:MAG: polyphosphate polymerase domain-containing protein [Planctomycetota bacterium]
MTSRLQTTRSELKFTVTESQAERIRDFLSSHLVPDENNGRFRAGYRVCSVYLDSQDGKLYRQTSVGQKNRFKLRARIYDDNPNAPAFLEIKRREGAIIRKSRASVSRSLAVEILSGRDPAVRLADELGTVAERYWRELREFIRSRDTIAAAGSVVVDYDREAYVSRSSALAGNDYRATFDRSLSAQPYRIDQALCFPTSAFDTPFYETVVFELKFTNRFPLWMQDLVRSFNLIPTSFPKYLHCADTLSGNASPIT